MGLTFSNPAWLFVLLLIIPTFWIGLKWFASMGRVRRWSVVLARAALLALIAAILAGLSSERRSDRIAVIGVFDVSDSVRLFANAGLEPQGRPLDPLAPARSYFSRALAGRGPDDLAGIVMFDGRAAGIAMPTRGELPDREPGPRMGDGTDIASALRLAAALIPPDASGRLVLFSDGVQTTGDAAAAARQVASGAGGQGRLRIDTVPINLRTAGEVLVESVDSPPRSAADAPVTVRVSLVSSGASRGRLSLTHNGDLLDINGAEPGSARLLNLTPGRHVELISVQLPPGRVHQFRALYEPEAGAAGGDTRPENNSGEAFTYSPGRGAVLLVDGVSQPGGAERSSLAGVLRSAGIEVTVVPAEGIPQNLLALQAYDLIILENIPAEAVPEETQRLIDVHVRQMGSGLVMIGGPDSLGAGGWKGSILEPLLPVRLDLPEKLVQPDAAVVFVLDNSGSMGRGVVGSLLSQQEIANQSAALAVKSLAKGDLVGVIEFNNQTSVVVPLAPNKDADRTADKILSISAGGGTRLGPALEEARRQLSPAKAAVKHVIVLSDGRSMESGSLPGIARRMQEEGVTVSTISVGDQADDETMSEIARQGGGRFYAVNNANLLPRFFLKAVRVVRTPLIREGSFDPVLLPSGSPLTAGISSPPPLGGLILSQRRPEPTITYAMETPTGEPLLAHWNVELGQVAVFASDAHAGGWADRWIDWPGFAQLWTQVTRSLARRATPNRLEWSVDAAGDSLRLRLEASGDDGRPLDSLEVPATIRTPSGQQLSVTLVQSGPGVYEAEVPASESGSYVAIATPRQGPTRLPPVIAGSTVASGAEFRDLRTNTALLEQIASETGGRVLDLTKPESAAFFDRAGVTPRIVQTPLWPTLLAWTLLVLLVDIGTRRIAWDRFVSREFGVDLAKAASEAVAERGAGAARAAGKLRHRPRVEPPPVAPEVRLSESDATKLAETERERRRVQRLEALRALRESQRSETAPIQAEESAPAARRTFTPPAQPTPAPEAGGAELLAAKKRARERFAAGESSEPES